MYQSFSWSRDKVATGLSCQYSPDMGRGLTLVMKAQELDVLFGKVILIRINFNRF